MFLLIIRYVLVVLWTVASCNNAIPCMNCDHYMWNLCGGFISLYCCWKRVLGVRYLVAIIRAGDVIKVYAMSLYSVNLAVSTKICDNLDCSYLGIGILNLPVLWG
jgi:hypothetical protein